MYTVMSDGVGAVLTTLCRKPFMTATFANAPQAVRASDGDGEMYTIGSQGVVRRGRGGQVAIQQGQSNRHETRRKSIMAIKGGARLGRHGGRLRWTEVRIVVTAWEIDGEQDWRSSLWGQEETGACAPPQATGGEEVKTAEVCRYVGAEGRNVGKRGRVD